MFCKQNLFIARLDSNIVGIILWHSGPLIWENKSFIASCSSQNATIAPTFEQVALEYLGTYDRPTADISIVNVCVNSSVRGIGIGTAMLHTFIDQHQGKSLELVTLKENAIAIDLYKRNGFEIQQEEDGFSIANPKPRCYAMFCKAHK